MYNTIQYKISNAPNIYLYMYIYIIYFVEKTYQLLTILNIAEIKKTK